MDLTHIAATVLFLLPIYISCSSFCHSEEYSCKRDGITHCEPLADRGDKMLPIEKPACRQDCQDSQLWCEERNKCIHKSEVCDCGPDKIYCSKGGKYSCENRKGILTSSVFNLCQDGSCHGTCQSVGSECNQRHFQCGGQCKNFTLVVDYRQCVDNCIPANLLCYKPSTHIVIVIVLVIVVIAIGVTIVVFVYLWKRGYLKKLKGRLRSSDKASAQTGGPKNNSSQENVENVEGHNNVRNNETNDNQSENKIEHSGDPHGHINTSNCEESKKKQSHKKINKYNNYDHSENKNKVNQLIGGLDGYTNMSYLEERDEKTKNKHETRNRYNDDELNIATSSPTPYHTILLSSLISRATPGKKNTKEKRSRGLNSPSNSNYGKESTGEDIQQIHEKRKNHNVDNQNIAKSSPANYSKSKNKNRENQHNEDLHGHTNINYDDRSVEEQIKQSHEKRNKLKVEDQNEVTSNQRNYNPSAKKNTKDQHYTDLHGHIDTNCVEERVEEFEKYSHKHRNKSSVDDRNTRTTNIPNDDHFRKKRDGKTASHLSNTSDASIGKSNINDASIGKSNINDASIGKRDQLSNTNDASRGKRAGTNSRKSSSGSKTEGERIGKNTPTKSKQDRHTRKSRY